LVFLLLAEVMDQDVKDEFESVDFGANFGLSYGFTEKLFGQARIQYRFVKYCKR